MSLIFADDVVDTSTSTGTGSVVLAASPPTPTDRTFGQVMAVNDTIYGRIRHQTTNEWEIGLYTYSATNTLSRTQILASSNAGGIVSFSAGTKVVDAYI